MPRRLLTEEEQLEMVDTTLPPNLFDTLAEEEDFVPPEVSREFKQLIKDREEKQKREAEARIARRKQSKKRRASRAKKEVIALFDATIVETDLMYDSGDWTDAEPRHLVSLFGKMHAKVYGLAFTELDENGWYQAVAMAKRFVEAEFSGEMDAALDFYQWLWTEETRKHTWKIQNFKPLTRLSVYATFGKKYITDYRLNIAHRQRRI